MVKDGEDWNGWDIANDEFENSRLNILNAQTVAEAVLGRYTLGD